MTLIIKINLRSQNQMNEQSVLSTYNAQITKLLNDMESTLNQSPHSNHDAQDIASKINSVIKSDPYM